MLELPKFHIELCTTRAGGILAPAALGFVEAALATPGTEIMAVVCGRETPVVTAALPLVPHRYIRG